MTLPIRLFSDLPPATAAKSSALAIESSLDFDPKQPKMGEEGLGKVRKQALRKARLVSRLLRWTPDFGRPDKVELPGWEAPYQEQDDGREATSIRGGV